MIVDSVVWIALKYQKDKYHSQALDHKDEIFNGVQIYVTDYITIETYSFLLRKIDVDTAKETLNMFHTSDKIEVIYNTILSYRQTLEILNKYPFLSIVDANIIYHAGKLDLEYVTFDERLNQIQT